MRPSRSDWRAEGEEPDYRFSLANERTFLAWIRTTLGILAGAVAISQLFPTFATPAVRTAISLALAGCALICAACSYPRWRTVERAMRNSSPLPPFAGLAVIWVGVTLVAVSVLVALAVTAT